MARKAITEMPKSGKSIADEIIAQRKRSRARRAKAIATHTQTLRAKAKAAGPMALKAFVAPQTRGYLIAAGDSWFDYPGQLHLNGGLTLNDDVLEQLEEAGYDVESTAHAGDPIEAMAFGGSGQLGKLAKCFEKVKAQGAMPKAVLLSGGGDDIAGSEFGMLINHSASPIAGWNDEVVDGVINVRIAGAYRRMFEAIATLSQYYAGKALPVLVHGYDYAVPDGRNFGGLPFFPGPWLRPGFDEKQFTELQVTTGMVESLIDRFNAMLQKLAQASGGSVHYIDLRGTLSNSLISQRYQKWWANELHPTPPGFKAVAARFATVLDAL
ncbi:MAG: hypothetical protein JSR65_00420 [Proteobacteria bacterium]|nr:hypothetical protein [Pseudomonadota bacterium]